MSVKRKISLIVIGILTSVFAYFYFSNPLFRDEDLIEHIEKHKNDFATLVEKFEAYDAHPHFGWEKNDQVQKYFKSLFIHRMYESGFKVWLPDPYSREMAEDFDSKTSKDKFSEIYKYVAIAVRFDEPYYFKKFSIHELAWIWKEIVYFPHAPKIINGYLMGPVNKKGKSIPLGKVVGDLNGYPVNWKRGQCYLRKIDDRWFIRMCKSE